MSSRTRQTKGLRRSARNRQQTISEVAASDQERNGGGGNKEWLEAEWFRQWEACARQVR